MTRLLLLCSLLPCACAPCVVECRCPHEQPSSGSIVIAPNIPPAAMLPIDTGSLEYVCPICGKRFRTGPGGTIVSCAVIHPPGTCCHYGQTEVKP
jgi:hypothetical protein